VMCKNKILSSFLNDTDLYSLSRIIDQHMELSGRTHGGPR